TGGGDGEFVSPGRQRGETKLARTVSLHYLLADERGTGEFHLGIRNHGARPVLYGSLNPRGHLLSERGRERGQKGQQRRQNIPANISTIHGFSFSLRRRVQPPPLLSKTIQVEGRTLPRPGVNQVFEPKVQNTVVRTGCKAI